MGHETLVEVEGVLNKWGRLKDMIRSFVGTNRVGGGNCPSCEWSCPLSCCPQSLEILSSALNAPGSRTFIATVHIAAAVIGWKRSGKERTEQTQFSTKFAVKLSFMNLSAQCTFFSCFLKSRPPCDQTRGSGAVFIWLYG